MTELDNATRYAERLAAILAAKHYPKVPQWQPLFGDLVGLLMQIDNMTSGMVRDDWRPTGRVVIEHDGFSGDVIGRYTTREGKRGVVVQQDGTRVVHVYGEKWLSPSPPKAE